MKIKQKIAAIALLVLLGAVAYGLFHTGRPASAPPMNAKTASAAAAQAPMVDQTPLLTAQRLAQMPTSTEEKTYAEEALRIADTSNSRVTFSPTATPPVSRGAFHGGVLGVETTGAGDVVERTAHLGHHGMADDEADTAVGRVEV